MATKRINRLLNLIVIVALLLSWLPIAPATAQPAPLIPAAPAAIAPAVPPAIEPIVSAAPAKSPVAEAAPVVAPVASEPAHPLGDYLLPDGTLNLPQGFQGNLDTRGWQMVSDPKKAPRFTNQVISGIEQWSDSFGLSGSDGVVQVALADGRGNVYLGGDFTAIYNIAANHVAKWDGQQWSALGSGTNNTVSALALDSHGNLYVGGSFTTAGGKTASRIAQWDGSAWSALGSGINGPVYALAVAPDDTLYAGGGFDTAGGTPVKSIAKWNGSAWSALGTGVDVASNYGVRALLFSNGALYVGGDFTTAGGTTVRGLARWNGSAWSGFGTGIAYGSTIYALALDGSGNLYVVGDFTAISGVAANRIAKWNGTTWSALGTGLDGYNGGRALLWDATGKLYVGGYFNTAGGLTSPGVAQWDPAANSGAGGWMALAANGPSNGGGSGVIALARDAAGVLYAGGTFSQINGVTIKNLALWDGSAWSRWKAGGALNWPVYAMAVDGAGNVYVGGNFDTAGDLTVSNIAKWDGVAWSALGSGIGNIYARVYALTIYSNTLYAGGSFETAGGVPAKNIAQWDGSAWSALGGGICCRYGDIYVSALTVDNAGTLYAGGYYTQAGGVSANNIAQWNGSVWSALGSGVKGKSYAEVYALTPYSNTLYAGGVFTQAGSVSANNIAVWNRTTSSWAALGTGITGSVSAIARDSTGNVYATGKFTQAGSVAANNIAMWDPTVPEWVTMTTGLSPSGGGYALALDSFGDLYVGGTFTQAGSLPAANLAKWDGTNWAAVAGGVNNKVTALTKVGETVYVGGDFGAVGGTTASVNFAILGTADVGFTKDVTPTVAPYHGVVTYTIVLTSAGTIAPYAVLSDTLPPELDFSRWITQSGAQVISDTILWGGVIKPITPTLLVFEARHVSATGGTVYNTANLRVGGVSEQVDATCTFAEPTFIISMTKSVTPLVAVPIQGLVTYTLVISNTGLDADPQVTMLDTMPSGKVEFVDWIEQPANAWANLNQVGWSGPVDVGEIITVSFTVSNTGDYRETITNTARFTGTAQSGVMAVGFSAEPGVRITLLRSGAGSVTSDPTGINCGAACAWAFGAGQVVTLTATPELTTTFAGWSGGGCSGADDCALTLSQDVTVTALFKINTDLVITSDAPDPSPMNEPITVTYTLTPQGAGTPTGVVTITMAGDPATCVGPLPSVSCVITPTAPGYNPLTASYSGDGDFAASQDTEPHLVYDPHNLPVTVTVTSVQPVTTVVGQPVVVSYTVGKVIPLPGDPSGNVVVVDGDGAACVGTVATGVCELNPLRAGVKTLLAVYVGNDDYQGGFGGQLHAVIPATTTTQIKADVPDPSLIGQAVKVYYAVTVNPPGGGTPKGNVSVSDGDGNTCVGTLAAGRCTLISTQRGIKQLTASYSGTGDYGSSQGVTDHQVNDTPIRNLTTQVISPAYMATATHLLASITAGTNAVYRWDFGDGSLPITTTDANVYHTYAFVEVYTATVTAANEGSAATASRVVNVVDRPISGLQLQANPLAVMLGETIFFTATATTGTNVIYTWDFGDGAPLASGATLEHVYAGHNSYTVTLLARNGTSALTRAIAVGVVSEIAGFTAGNNSPTNFGDPTVFTASVRSGLGVVYQWNFGNGTPVYVTPDFVTRYVYPLGGVYTVIVTATNGARSQHLTLPVTIQDALIYGLSAVSSEPTQASRKTYFTATVEGGTSVFYAWNFGDGSAVVTGPYAQHTYIVGNEATFTAIVTATNTRGQQTTHHEVSLYINRETRTVNAVRISANAFYTTTGGRVLALGGVAFADGAIRLTGAGAAAEYTASSVTFTGTLEMRGDKSLTIGNGQFTASTASGRSSSIVINSLFTTLSGFPVTGVTLDQIDLVKGQVKGTAASITLNPPHVSVTTNVLLYQVDVINGLLQVSGKVGAFDLAEAGTTAAILAGSRLSNEGVIVSKAAFIFPAAVGGRQARGQNLRLTPNGITLDPFNVTFTGTTARLSGVANLWPTANGYLFEIAGTLALQLPQNRLSLPVTAVVNEAGLSIPLSSLTLKASTVEFKLPNVNVTDLNTPLTAAFGILQLPDKLGGGSRRVDNFSMDTTGLLIAGKATFEAPTIRLLEGALVSQGAQVTATLEGSGFNLTIEGPLDLGIPSLTDLPQVTLTLDRAGRLGGGLDEFSIPIAFLDLSVSKAGIKPDGSVYAESATISYDKLTATVYNIAVGRNGLKIGGGSFELPDIDLKSFKIISVGGKLIRTAQGYDIGAQGGFQIASVGGQKGAPSGGGCNGIWVAALFSVNTAGKGLVNIMPVAEAPQTIQAMTGFRLKEATLKVFCEIPIGQTGFYLTEVRGTVEIGDSSFKISLGMTVGTKEVKDVRIIEADADVSLQFNPFELALTGVLRVFTYEVAQAEAKLWVNQKSKGFSAKLHIEMVVAEGDFQIAAWSDYRGFSFTASAQVTWAQLLSFHPFRS